MTVTSNMADKIHLGVFKTEDKIPPLSGLQVTNSYERLLDELSMFKDNPYVARASRAIEELLQIHRLDQSEIVRLRRMVEMKEDEKWQELKDGNRAPYRRADNG